MGRSAAESKPSRKEFSPQKESSGKRSRRPDSVSTSRDEHVDERHDRKMRRIRSRSRSRDRHGSRRRSTSRSRNNNRNVYHHFVGGRYRSFDDGRANPEPANCLGVFGMSTNTNERQLWAIFGRYGEVQRIEMVRDRFSGQSRGFAFVYFTNVRDASRAKERLDDSLVDGMRVRVDFSVTPHGGPYRHEQHINKSPERRRRRSRSPPRRRPY